MVLGVAAQSVLQNPPGVYLTPGRRAGIGRPDAVTSSGAGGSSESSGTIMATSEGAMS